MTSTNNINDILALHFAGEKLTDEQELFLIDWVSQNKEEYTHLSQIFLETKKSKQNYLNVEKAWEAVDKKTTVPKMSKIYQLREVLSLAACLAVILGLALSLLNKGNHAPTQYSNNTAILQTFILPDSTSVTLYPNSTITFVADAETQERRTEIEGKAFFKVKSNVEKPFIVKNNVTLIRVLGTSFLVDGDNQTETSVFVREGTVKVSTEYTEVILKAKDQALSDGSRIIKSTIDNPEILFGNHIREKAYQNVPLSKVITDIEAEFDIDIVCSDKIKTARINTRLKFMNPEDILSEISYICNIKYRKIADKKFEFYKP